MYFHLLLKTFFIFYFYQINEYTEELGTNGYKRSISQGDSNARESYIVNKEAGWILKNELFPGTNINHTPHGFNCRCYTKYSIVNPESGGDGLEFL